MSRARLRRRLVRAAGLPVLVMLLWVGVLLWQISRLVETAQWVDHTDQVLAQIHRAQADTAQQVAQVRAFLLTRSPELRPTLAHDGARGPFAELLRLTADNSEQSARTRAAAQMYANWWEVAQAEVAAVEAGHDAVALVRTQGLPAERELRQQLDEMKAAEDALRQERTARQSGVLRRVVIATSISAVLLGVLFSFAAWRQLATVAADYSATQHALESEAAALREAREALQLHAGTLQEQVARRTIELQRANSQLEAFAASVSHDLRAPLRGLQGLSQALLEDAGDRLEPDAREYASQIVKEAASMDQLIRDLLEYSRLGRADLTIGPVSLDDAVASALHSVRHDVAAREATVSVHPALGSVVGNRAVLVQVLVNLLSNAVKFSTDTPSITVCGVRRDGWVRVTCADNGIGVAPQHHERIFHVFERLHGAEAYPGTGIGLAIVREGVARMGGRVGVESSEGRGSRFWIELPEAEVA